MQKTDARCSLSHLLLRTDSEVSLPLARLLLSLKSSSSCSAAALALFLKSHSHSLSRHSAQTLFRQPKTIAPCRSTELYFSRALARVREQALACNRRVRDRALTSDRRVRGQALTNMWRNCVSDRTSTRVSKPSHTRVTRLLMLLYLRAVLYIRIHYEHNTKSDMILV